MKDKSKIYINLIKLSEEQQRKVIAISNPIKYNDGRTLLSFNPDLERWSMYNFVYSKQELSYPEFIKLFEGGEGENKPIDLNISKEYFIFNCDMHRQNLNGRESEKEIFIAGIESVIEELNIKFNSNQ